MDTNIILHSSSKSELKDLIAETLKEQLNSFFKKESEPSNRLLTRKEVAELLGISFPTLNTWTKEGIISAVRIGSSVRYKMADIELAMQEVKSIKYLRNRTF